MSRIELIKIAGLINSIVWNVVLLFLIIFLTIYFLEIPYLNEIKGWNGLYVCLETLCMAIGKTIVYFIETIIIGTAISSIGHISDLNSNYGVAALTIAFNCFLPLLFVVWIIEIVTRLYNIYTDDSAEKKPNIFNLFTSKEKLIPQYMWIPFFVLFSFITLFIKINFKNQLIFAAAVVSFVVFGLILIIMECKIDMAKSDSGKKFINRVKEIAQNFKKDLSLQNILAILNYLWNKKSTIILQIILSILSSVTMVVLIVDILIEIRQGISTGGLSLIRCMNVIILCFIFMLVVIFYNKKGYILKLFLLVMFLLEYILYLWNILTISQSILILGIIIFTICVLLLLREIFKHINK